MGTRESSGGPQAEHARADQRIGRASSAGPFLVLTLLAAVVFMGMEFSEDWVPHDEGVLGQSAERVLRGEVPHRDFDEVYTGLLTYAHAATFAVLPVSSLSLRVPLLVATLLWVAAVYRLALGFVPPGWASALALTALVWSVPNYPAPVPSWYILFAATFVALALFRWIDVSGPLWLAVAGGLCGIALLLKLTGLLVLLGAGLALLVLEPRNGLPATPPGLGLRWAKASLLIGVGALLTISVASGAREAVRFALPTSVLLVAGAWKTALDPGGTPTARETAARLTPFLLGCAVPLVVFGAIQSAAGALEPLVQNVFFTPFRRTTFAAMRPPRPGLLLLSIPVIALLVIPSPRARGRIVAWTAGSLFVAVLVLSRDHIVAYQIGWMSAWSLLFLVAAMGGAVIREPSSDPASVEDGGAAAIRARTTVLACLAVSLSLIEYPFAAPIYVLYSLPLVLLATAALVRRKDRVAQRVQAVVLAFFFLFGLLRVVPPVLGHKGVAFVRPLPTRTLEVPRGGIRIPEQEASGFETLVALVRDRGGGGPIWAGPDAPEVYFLTGLPNLTPRTFDFLSRGFGEEVGLVEQLESLQVRVAVLRLNPDFTPPLSATLVDSVRTLFADEQRVLDYLVLSR